MKRSLFLAGLLTLVTFGLTASLGLKPLKITVEAPREVFLEDPAANTKRPYWVVTYRLENLTGEDRELVLTPFLESDAKRLDQELERVGNLIHGPLEKIMQQRDGRRYKNVIELNAHPFRRGEVVDGIFIFPRPPRRSDELILYIDGLSGITIREGDRERLENLKRDFYTIVKPEKITWNNRSETRYRPMSDDDILAATGLKFRERLIYKRKFLREGDEFHVHEDDIRVQERQMGEWMLVLKPEER